MAKNSPDESTHPEQLDYEEGGWSLTYGVDGRTFDAFIEAVNAVAAECRLELEPDTISTEAVHPANVTKVIADVPANPREENFSATVGVGIEDLARTLDGMATPGTYRLDFHPDDDELDVIGAGERASVATHDPSAMATKTGAPETEHRTTAEPEAYRFKGVVGGLADVVEATSGTHGLLLTPEDGTVRVEGGRSPAPEDCEFEWSFAADVDPGEPVFYTASYLRDMVAAIPPTEDLTVRFGPDSPLQIEAGEWLTYYVAPRIWDQ